MFKESFFTAVKLDSSGKGRGRGRGLKKKCKKNYQKGRFHVRNCEMIQDSFRVKQRERGGEGGVCG